MRGGARKTEVNPLEQARQCMIELVNQLARFTRNEISAQIDNTGYIGNAYTIDALRMILRATSQVNRSDLRDLAGINIQTGSRPDAIYEDGIIILIINPEQGYGGRPSSARIAQAIRQ